MLSIGSAAVQTRGEAFGARLAASFERLEEALADERHQLVLWAPVILGAGVAAYFMLPKATQWAAAVSVGLAFAAAGLAAPGLAGRCLRWGGLLFALGVGVAWLRADQAGTPRLDHPEFARVITATVVALDLRPAEERYRMLVRPDDPALPPGVRLSLRRAPAVDIQPGARVRLRATLRPPPGPSIPGGYDFAQRAWFEGVGAVGYSIGSIELVRPAPPPGDVDAWLSAVRRGLTMRFQAAIEGPAGGIAAALVAGDRGGIPEAVSADMRDSGLAHLLSISGMHIAVVVGGTMWLVRRLLLLSMWVALRWPVKIIAATVAASAGVAYTLLAGAEVPTVRSCIATLVVLGGLCLGRQAISLRMVAAAAFLILLVRPEALLGASFQLSFAAVTAIVVFYQLRVGRMLTTARGETGIARRAAFGLVGLILTGILVEAALAPIALAHFGRTGLYGVFANVVAIPFTSFVVMPAAAAALLFDPVGLGDPAFAVLGWSLDRLIDLADTVAGWPGAVSRLPTMPTPAFALFVVGGLWLCLWEGRVRWAGVLPIIIAAPIALAARPADIIVSSDGRHAGLISDGRLAMLRPRAGSFIGDMWSDATASDELIGWTDAAARCTRDACLADVERGGRRWRLLATRSKALIDRRSLAQACAGADIVVSERRLPAACRPRWLKLDRTQLSRTGALAIWLDPVHVRTVAEAHGDHPWATAIRDQ